MLEFRIEKFPINQVELSTTKLNSLAREGWRISERGIQHNQDLVLILERDVAEVPPLPVREVKPIENGKKRGRPRKVSETSPLTATQVPMFDNAADGD